METTNVSHIRTLRARTRTHAADQRGFTLIEIQVSLVLMAIIAGMTVISVQNVLTAARGDTSMMQVASALRMARDTSISQRRTIDLQFIEPNRLQLIRNNIPAGTTVVGEIMLENGAVFHRDPSLLDPETGAAGETAIDFGGAHPLRFQPDGMLTDGTGVPITGTVYTTVTGQPDSARAVTVTGSSGRAQCYRWNGSRWEEQ
jgi:prepilin-type N-terminal cleavage/methylation domain-containing protein